LAVVGPTWAELVNQTIQSICFIVGLNFQVLHFTSMLVGCFILAVVKQISYRYGCGYISREMALHVIRTRCYSKGVRDALVEGRWAKPFKPIKKDIEAHSLSLLWERVADFLMMRTGQRS